MKEDFFRFDIKPKSHCKPVEGLWNTPQNYPTEEGGGQVIYPELWEH